MRSLISLTVLGVLPAVAMGVDTFSDVAFYVTAEAVADNNMETIEDLQELGPDVLNYGTINLAAQADATLSGTVPGGVASASIALTRSFLTLNFDLDASGDFGPSLYASGTTLAVAGFHTSGTTRLTFNLPRRARDGSLTLYDVVGNELFTADASLAAGDYTVWVNPGDYSVEGAAADATELAPPAYIDLSVTASLIADFNLDGTVDVTDLGTLAANFRGTGGFAAGDANGDGAIDVSDLGLLASNFRETTTPLTVLAAQLGLPTTWPGVPEPSSAAMIALPALMLRRRS